MLYKVELAETLSKYKTIGTFSTVDNAKQATKTHLKSDNITFIDIAEGFEIHDKGPVRSPASTFLGFIFKD